jgi:hypothetical protein
MLMLKNKNITISSCFSLNQPGKELGFGNVSGTICDWGMLTLKNMK